MNREWVEIVSIEPHGIWVESQQRSACDSCHARSGCGQQTLAKLGKPVRVWVPTAEHFSVGQSVMLELPSGGLALSAIMLYGIPLVALIIGSGIGQFLAADIGAVISGVVFMAVGLWLSNMATKQYSALWQPKIINTVSMRGACTSSED